MGDATGAPPETAGREILVYDPKRRPLNWTEIILPHQCAVFLRNHRLGISVNRDGEPRTAESATCILFDSIVQAEPFCQATVNAKLDLSCEILDYEGPMHPPLLTVVFNHSGGDDDTRGWFGRHRRIVFLFAVCAALPFFYYDFHHGGTLVLTIIGINIIVAGLRVLLWDWGSKNTERERLARLEAHRRREREHEQVSGERG
jgi:hypothetical protein